MKTYTQSFIVEQSHTASTLGSGSLEVFATPAMIAFVENTSVKCIDNLADGYTTVGIEINAKHLKASKTGETVTCTAKLTRQEGKVYEFDIEVFNHHDEKIGTATHKRIAVHAERFMNKL